MENVLKLLAVIFALFSLTGCGLKGPLYFPSADKTMPPPAKSVQPQSQSTMPEKNDRGVSDRPSQVDYQRQGQILHFCTRVDGVNDAIL